MDIKQYGERVTTILIFAAASVVVLTLCGWLSLVALGGGLR